MTVSTTSNRIVYTGNGTTTAFAFPYKFIATADLKVYVGGVLQTSGYTVGTPSDTGANVTFSSAPVNGAAIIILSDPARLQSTSLPSTGPFPAKSVETMADKLTLLVQRLYDLASRSLTLNDADSTTASVTLPTPAANNLIGWNETATGLQSVPLASLATSIVYGTARPDIFTGDGTTKTFTLSANPGALGNLDVAVGGVTQLPGIDFTWSTGTSLVFTSAPPLGAKILARYLQGLAQGASDSASAAFIQSGAGAVSRTMQDKGREWVSVLDYGADPTGLTDSTAAFTAAQNASDLIRIPPGTYLLDQFKQQNRKVFIGAGLNSTFIKQANGGRPAWWVVAKTGVYAVQIIGAQLKGVWFLGAGASATVASMIVEAVAPFIVSYSDFEIGGSGGYHTLEVISATANPVYSNRFSVIQQDPDNRSANIGSYNTGVVCGSGVYNEWYLNIVGAQNGIAMTDSSFNCLFHHVITDGQQQYNGQANVIVNATVEAWTGTAQTGAISNPGYNNRFISITLTNVPNTSVSGYGVVLNAASATITTILGYKIYGSYPGGAPLRPIQVGTSNSGFIADAEVSACPHKLEVYCTYDQLKNFTFSGDCSSLTAMSRKFPADIPFVTSSTYTIDANFSTTGQIDETVYLNSSANCTITLPSAASFIGRKIYVCSRVAFSLTSASANVLPMTGGPTPNILAATVGKWAILQAGSNGYWNIIANN